MLGHNETKKKMQSYDFITKFWLEKFSSYLRNIEKISWSDVSAIIKHDNDVNIIDHTNTPFFGITSGNLLINSNIIRHLSM